MGPIEVAARRYDDMRREYILRCEPYVRVMCDLRNMQSVRYQVQESGGLVEIEVLWREDSKQLYDHCQEMIDHIKQQYTTKGGTNNGTATEQQYGRGSCIRGY